MNGLIVAGGKSTRMLQDKAFLEYNNIPQYKVVQNLLKPYCKEIYISLQHQNAEINIPQLIDAQQEIGPITALASAYECAKTNWLVVAIDYPLLQAKDIKHLVNTFTITNTSSVYYNKATNIFEPFIAIYTAQYLENIVEKIANNQFSMQKILAQFAPEKVLANNNKNITSIDTPEEYLSIKNKIS
jgi:molybdenum cofactor guanylyltransferase